MARIEIGGLGIEYELIGDAGAPAVAVTPGGRFSKDSPGVRELAERLVAGGRRALLWDRPNTGASDICFDGPGESTIQATALTRLIHALDLGPTALVGGSGGSRVSLLAALHDPQAVSHLGMWWISGGLASLMMLGASYACEPAFAASMGGMEAVAAMPAFAEQIARNPRNREIILRQDPKTFIATMERWAAGFLPAEAHAVPGVSRADLAALPMPVLIFHGSSTDLYHPDHVTIWVHAAIPHSKMIDLPWPDDIFAKRLMAGFASGKPMDGLFVDWPDLAPAILEFVGG